MLKSSPKQTIKVTKRSGFDKSHFNFFSGKVGVEYPILVDEVIGNSTINLRCSLAGSMPPLAGDTYMKCDMAVEAFFVPHRIIYPGFEDFFCQRETLAIDDTGTQGYGVHTDALPVGRFDISLNDNIRSDFGIGGLPDFLGFRSSAYATSQIDLILAPFVAYWLIWEHYYRNPLLEKPAFGPNLSSDSAILHYQSDIKYAAAALTSSRLTGAGVYTNIIVGTDTAGKQDDWWTLLNGKRLTQLFHRNFGLDYFTNSFPTPQNGNAQVVEISNAGDFTIAALRAANSLQQWAEKNQLAGTRYQDMLKARYGADLSNGVAQRPVLLGSAKYDFYNRSMVVSAGNENSNISQYNPWMKNSGGVQGNAYVQGSDLIIDGFTANEPGYIMVLACLVPKVTYSTGCRRYLRRYCQMGGITDMADPALQNTGYEPIYQWELNGVIGIGNSQRPVFAYTDRYASWMTMEDELHGQVRQNTPVYDLSYLVAQRFFDITDTPVIGKAFLEIPTFYLDNVMVYSDTDMSGSYYGYWCQCGFDYKVVMPLAEYSIPSLQDPAYEHGDSVTIHRGGFRF